MENPERSQDRCSATVQIRPRPFLGSEAGQAISEYALIVAALMGGVVFVGFNFIPEFIKALQTYYNGFFILLNIPFP